MNSSVGFVGDLNIEHLSGKHVLLRVDFNVPLQVTHSNSVVIENDVKIRATLPTIKFLRNNQAKVVICSHLGRPKGKVNPMYSLVPVAHKLSEYLDHITVNTTPDCVEAESIHLIKQMQPGDVLVLENLRFHSEEEVNDDTFSRHLAQDMDLYVNDAFGAAHRGDSSRIHSIACVADLLLFVHSSCVDGGCYSVYFTSICGFFNARRAAVPG